MLDKFSTPEDQAIAKAYIHQLRAGEFVAIEKTLDSSMRSPNVHEVLVKMAAAIPPGEPKSVKLVGARRGFINLATTVESVFEYQFDEKWLLISVMTKEADGVKTLYGFHVNVEQQSIDESSRFTFAGKSIDHVIFFIMTVAVFLFTIGTLILCAVTKLPGKKWPWIIFILCGCGQVAFNWTTGAVTYNIFFVTLLGTAAWLSNGTWILSFSLPIGAISFLIYWANLPDTKAESFEQPRYGGGE